MLFRWVWHDSADDRPDGPEDDDPADRPPLRDRVLARHASAVKIPAWRSPTVVRKPPAGLVAPPTHARSRVAYSREAS
jgi:hypothetical protein